MNPWWLGLGPAQAPIPCGEHTHRLRWEQGALRAMDHDDPEAERALAALGGQRCQCVEVLDAWSRHEADPRVLVLASRGAADPLAARADWTAQLGSLVPAAISALSTVPPAPKRQLLRLPYPRRPPGPALPGRPGSASPPPGGPLPLGSDSESALVALLGLGGGLPDRLVATVAAAGARLFEADAATLGGVRATLYASMHGRLCAVLRTWLGRIDLEVELELVGSGRAPILSERAGVVRAELPFAWLAEVWSRGLGTVMGRFCLAASTEEGRRWRLTTVGPELGLPSPVTIELGAA